MSNLNENYVNGVLRQQWDDATRVYTAWDEDGEVVQGTPRAYTDPENAAADATIAVEQQVENKSTVETNLEADFIAMQGIVDQTNADLRADPSQEIKAIARAVRRLTRIALDDYSGTE